MTYVTRWMECKATANVTIGSTARVVFRRVQTRQMHFTWPVRLFLIARARIFFRIIPKCPQVKGYV